jgi:hypothetical protein
LRNVEGKTALDLALEKPHHVGCVTVAGWLQEHMEARRVQPRSESEAGMFFELRQYHIRPGQRDAWVKCMEEEIIPFQVKMGMVILGSFVGEEDENVYVWIRRFENEQERKRLYDAVYQSDYWKNEIAPKVPTLIDREQIKVTRLVATPRSVIQ